MDVMMVDAQRKLVPEMMELMQQRYRVLNLVKMAGPIGRRPLGQMVGLSERETRTVMDLLREQNLIQIAKEGATITSEGVTVLLALGSAMEEWSGRVALAKKLTQFLGIRSVKVVAGNSDYDSSAKSSLGMESAEQFMSEIGDGKIIAVTGGSSVAAIPDHMEKSDGLEDLLFIAARGGVGEDIGSQANVIAASFAEACGGKYNTFYYPESLSEETQEAFRKEPSVMNMLALYERTDCVLHGIGDALTMAAMRNSSEEERQLLADKDAKGEAFGYYFDENGNVVYQIHTIGIQTDHLTRIPLIISVAGGKSKAEAILSYMATAPKQTILVTDEGAANEMLKVLINK